MKTSKTPFSYVVLRYMHDAFTREFLNVGVLLHAPQAGFVGFEKLAHLDRVRATFPGLQSESLRDLLAFLASRTEEIQNKASELFDRDVLSAEAVAKSLLPTDDSALQWSTPGGGVTDEPQQALKELFERLVMRYLKTYAPTRRDDADIWKAFERELRQRNVLHRLQEKVLAVGELRHRFERAWQPTDGHLRLFQPLSFDLLEPSDIVEKAVRWGALIHHLRAADPGFFIYFLLGRPSEGPHYFKAFQQARKALNEDDGDRKELVPEEEAPKFAAEVEREINAAA
jgi:hypothetical protein